MENLLMVFDLKNKKGAIPDIGILLMTHFEILFFMFIAFTYLTSCTAEGEKQELFRSADDLEKNGHNNDF